MQTFRQRIRRLFKLQSSIHVAILSGTVLLAPLVRAQSEGIAARIDSIAHAALHDGPIAGLSISVVKDGEVLHSRGYGSADIDNGIPAGAQTLFNAASVAKIMAAALVLRYVEKGQLSLDSDLTTLLPSFPNKEQGRTITLRQLLNHTSGLNDYVAADVARWETTGKPLEPSFVLDYLRDRPLDFAPGTEWRYSNTGFYLAGLIVERVVGRPWGEVVIEEIARPLGLNSIVLCDEAGQARSVGYEVATADSFKPNPEDAEEGVRGDAGLCSNTLDLAMLPHALTTRRILSESSVSAMLRPTRLVDDVVVDYGLGVARGELDGHPLWGHLGGNASSHVATLAHYPDDDLSIAVLVNTRSGSVGSLIVEAAVARVVLELGTPGLADNPLSNAAQAKYVGAYEGDRGPSRYNIVTHGSRLARMWSDDTTSIRPLLHQHAHSFGRADWPMDRFVFHLVDGRARGYSTYYNGIFDGYYRRVD